MTATTTIPPRPPEPTRPNQEQPPTRRRARTATIMVASAILAIAGVLLWSLTIGTDEVVVIRPSADVTHVEVDIGGGTIAVTPATELSVTVEHRGRSANDLTATDTVTDGVLRVTDTCGLVNLGRCTTAVTVELPPDVRISMTTGAGSISGTVANGRVDAATDAGSIDLTVTGDISSLSATAGVGSIDLRVPDTIYAVDGHTGIGQTRIDVRTDRGAPGAITARAEVGDVTVRPIGGGQR